MGYLYKNQCFSTLENVQKSIASDPFALPDNLILGGVVNSDSTITVYSMVGIVDSKEWHEYSPSTWRLYFYTCSESDPDFLQSSTGWFQIGFQESSILTGLYITTMFVAFGIHRLKRLFMGRH